LKMKIY